MYTCIYIYIYKFITVDAILVAYFYDSCKLRESHYSRIHRSIEMSNDKHEHSYVPISANHPYYCSRCDQLGFGSSYTCSKSECNLFHHEQCENPVRLVEHPFSKKCVFKFHGTNNGPGEDSLCDVCGKKIKGYHYRCLCKFIIRNAHPSCLSYKPTLVAIEGLTLHLKKRATAKCLHCGTKDLWSKVRGWAYVSKCEKYCYHVSCVMEIINCNWRDGFITGKSDPFQTIKEKFPADNDRMHKIVVGRKKEMPTRKNAMTVLRVIFDVLTGNPLGLIGVANSYFGNQ